MFYKASISLCLLVLLLLPHGTKAYSVLTHEALIDANWEKVLLPLLKQKYPAADTEALKEAHAYAYGGAVVPDMGYYPSGSKLFTSLLHYVRTGDFVEQLLEDANGVHEYAFALGVLCHYYADRYGHSVGINLSVPLIYSKVKDKYGDTVTWADDHISHIRTEFSFDVLQTARGVYASAAYQDFIGFKVADEVLQKTFLKTYGLNLDDVFRNMTRTIAIFRWTATNLFPFITRTAWATKKNQVIDSVPGATAKSFIYRMNRKNYNKQFSKRERPGFTAYVVAWVIRVLPKIGPLRPLKFRHPTAQAEKKFIQSFDSSSAHYAATIAILAKKDPGLANIDFDTGNATLAGEYDPADQAYHDWLLKLQAVNFNNATIGIRNNILSFYNGYAPVTQTRKQKKERDKAMSALAVLQALSF